MRWDFIPMTGSVSLAKDEQSLRHTLALLPSANGSDGFFIARWKRGQKIDFDEVIWNDRTKTPDF